LLNPNGARTAGPGHLTDLVYELLDAHLDTMRLAGDWEDTVAWGAHLDYLRDLQRVGRETLAQLSSVGCS
jgi:hypothetical protein